MSEVRLRRFDDKKHTTKTFATLQSMLGRGNWSKQFLIKFIPTLNPELHKNSQFIISIDINIKGKGDKKAEYKKYKKDKGNTRVLKIE